MARALRQLGTALVAAAVSMVVTMLVAQWALQHVISTMSER